MVTRKQERALRDRIESLESDVDSMQHGYDYAVRLLREAYEKGLFTDEHLELQAKVFLLMESTISNFREPVPDHSR